MIKLQILDAFSGLGGWVKPWINNTTYNINIDSVDIINRPHINHHINILDFSINKEYDIVYASPPCNHLTKMNFKSSKEDIKYALLLFNRAFELAKEAKLCYIIENPYTGLAPKIYPNYIIVDYSQYNFPMRKRTAIWSNLPLKLKLQDKYCYNKFPISYIKKEKRAEIPYKLSKHIKEVIIKRYNKELQKYKK